MSNGELTRIGDILGNRPTPEVSSRREASRGTSNFVTPQQARERGMKSERNRRRQASASIAARRWNHRALCSAERF